MRAGRTERIDFTRPVIGGTPFAALVDDPDRTRENDRTLESMKRSDFDRYRKVKKQ
jgi:hypothetical protein